MPTYLETWSEAVPNGNEAKSLGDDRIRQFKTAMRERLAEDHYFAEDESGVNEIGYHKKVTLPVQADNPTIVTSAGQVYSKDVSGKAELFWQDEDGNVIQLTSAGIINLSTALVGETRMYGGLAAPSGWLACDGSAVSRTTYAALFAVIGTRFGVGDSATTFNLPSMTGKVARGAATPGTGDGADKLSGNSGSHVLTEAELPSHDHIVGYGSYGEGAASGYPEPPYNAAFGGWSTDRTQKAGSGDGHVHPLDDVALIPSNEKFLFIIKT